MQHRRCSRFYTAYRSLKYKILQKARFMKKYLVACLALLLYSTLSAQAHALNEKYQDLNLQEREAVFQVLKMDDSTFFAENLIPFGFASFRHGDILTGATTCVIDLATIAVVAAGNGWTIGAAPIGYVIGRSVGFYTMGKHIPEYNQQLKYDLGIDELSLEHAVMGHIQLAAYQFTF